VYMEIKTNQPKGVGEHIRENKKLIYMEGGGGKAIRHLEEKIKEGGQVEEAPPFLSKEKENHSTPIHTRNSWQRITRFSVPRTGN